MSETQAIAAAILELLQQSKVTVSENDLRIAITIRVWLKSIVDGKLIVAAPVVPTATEEVKPA